jgi:hypothetical protein
MGGNVNSGKERSEMDVADLRQFMRLGESIEETADFLCRDAEKVREKQVELRRSDRKRQALAFRSAREREWSGSQS